MMNTTNGSSILAPEQVAELLVRPALAAAVAAQVATVINVQTNAFRIPVVSADPTAAWVAEGGEIAPSDMALDEVTVVPRKIAGLSIISRELADDSSPAAAQAVGDGLARDIARKLDEAFFGALAAPAPPGLGSLTGVAAVSAGTSFANLDPFAEGQSLAEVAGATISAWIASPQTALKLAQLREGTASNRSLLGADPTVATRRVIFGAPLFVSNAVPVGTVWGIPLDRAMLIVREDADVAVDASPFFTSDRIAIRATMRVAFGFPHAAAIVRIKTTA